MNKTNNTYIVVGSGALGVLYASTLIKKRNVKVLMIDSGYELEKKIESKI